MIMVRAYQKILKKQQSGIKKQQSKVMLKLSSIWESCTKMARVYSKIMKRL